MTAGEIHKTRKILLIEDELPIAKALILKLARAGFDVEHLEDGKEAAARVKKEHYDLIILDLVMPNTDGFEVLKEIKEFTKETPIVVWSNLSQPEDVARAKELGAREYWVKLTTPLAMVLDRVSGLIEGGPNDT